MLKLGKSYRFLYPERDTYPHYCNAIFAVKNGHLIIGKLYKVFTKAVPSDGLKIIKVISDTQRVWSIGEACFKEDKPKRNLPDWF